MAYDGDDDDDDGPGFLSTFLLLGGLGAGAWFLYRTIVGQAQAAAALPGATALPGVLSTSLNPDGTTTSLVSTNPGAPLGVQNNNPGNIKYNAANNWLGQVGMDASGFATFSDPVYGLRAAFMVLQSYAAAMGSGFNIGNIAARWTSGDAAATQAGWVATVQQVSGIPAGQQIDPTDPTQMAALVSGIVAAENGQAYASAYAATIPQAWSMVA